MTEQKERSHDTTFPEALRAFIVQSFDSMALIEVLLLLHREKDRRWTIEGLASELRSSLSSVSTQLEKLMSLRFVQVDQGYRYSAPSAEMDFLVDELAAHYVARKTSMAGLIYSDRSESGIHAFSNAFKWRKD